MVNLKMKFHIKMGNLLLMDKKSIFLISKYFKSINFNVQFNLIFRKQLSGIPWGQLGMRFSLTLNDQQLIGFFF